ncbi:MAG: hypothetical protein K2Y29_16620 [Beijerinckiaceae bacterium]|nr:hypothetical protein [Beijerinckiaceae bacterium]
MFEALRVTQLSPEQMRILARDLGEMWGRVSRQHLAAGQGCACGFGGGLMLQGAAFELDIVEFLIDEAKQAGHGDLVTFIDVVAKRGPDNYNLPALLDALGNADHPAAPETTQVSFGLARLRATLSSMDEIHARGRFACD